ncbi:nucleoside hydrolase [Neolewinella antarctica]|uniref:Inosine/uridine-preferring nucleoside hydrolase domain-containing protein n=1 Tax=Neolewinella antarctica TaxID=442734 RepID=A0ABX0X7S3_9BACT|nr:nucleoside hydrolase [Neolewinella antarctica]NJC25268.1 hypothetical protein [Neolewinella antarctica]
MKRSLPTIVAVAVAVFTVLGVIYFFRNIIGDRDYGNVVSADAPNATTEYIIDAGTGNGVDDVFAIVGALARDDRGKTGPRLAGITASQYHDAPLAAARSADAAQAINEELARLTLRPDMRTLVGSNRPLSAKNKPLKSRAAAFIVERASRASSRNKLHIFVLGSCTNVASAILLDPEIIPVIHVHYLGFDYHGATGLVENTAGGSGSDPIALELLLTAPRLELTVMPRTVGDGLRVDRAELATKLPREARFTQYLMSSWGGDDRRATGQDGDPSSQLLPGVALVSAWFDPQLAMLKEYRAPVEDGNDVKVCTDITEVAMLDNWFEEVVEALE